MGHVSTFVKNSDSNNDFFGHIHVFFCVEKHCLESVIVPSLRDKDIFSSTPLIKWSEFENFYKETPEALYLKVPCNKERLY